jgi:CspA family cold shock protein
MQLGTVKWYDSRKGYGFIVTQDGEDVLAHFSVIEGEGFRRLFDGEEVEFEATRGPRGLNATFVRRTNHDRRKNPKSDS